MPGGFVAVELVARAGDGKLVPDIEDLDDLQRFATHEEAIGVWHLEKGLHVAVLRRVGRYSGMLIFEADTSTQAAWNALSVRLGAKTFTYVEAASRPAAQLVWLRNQGFVGIRSHAEGDPEDPGSDPLEAIHPLNTISGHDAISVAIPAVDGRVYYRSVT